MALVLALAASAPSTAAATGVVAGPVAVDRTELVVARDGDRTTITARFRVRTEGRAASLIIPVPEGSTARVVDGAAIDALRARTAPAFVEYAPVDPCSQAKDGARGAAWAFPAPAPALPAKIEAEVVDSLADLPVTKAQRRALERRTKRFVLVQIAATRGVRDRWTAPVQWSFDGDATLALHLAAASTSPGAEHLVTLFTLAPDAIVQPVEPITDLASGVPIAEVALELPTDTVDAIARHTLRRKRDEGWVRLFGAPIDLDTSALGGSTASSVVGRFAAVASSSAERELALASRVVTVPFRTEWWIRRKWRAPIACEAPRFENHVRIQQTAELRAYAAMTGRPIAALLARSRAGGYEQLPSGKLKPLSRERPAGGVER